ncbi:SCP2 sterol-binding domain-containing protein [Streptomonospora nanhaiensis]|uniref:Putative sterol carrier protein n=1 Tax=Streptomonospora nanhaiensis TaxID=1323731 RepID=A0A853BWN2_9ACTN|nr:SCP2 sterol-binding domain-containing protein [Streptomonospora nanhaiensis]MBV2365694.1 SCP2 sterol-binding domain-containing protein [Streptomonospora nanhaiensis]MBX9390674.1 SCP2 sterol-binding domain-containing protein [Streptomonospora nanhaiensis]NYI98867.1 putative sterol carrier protein [Streptomonospora nanhaiensis]
MASIEQCREAIDRVSERIAKVDPADRRKHIVERSVSVIVSDLDAVFDMRLTEDGLRDVSQRAAADPGQRAQVRITASSDDLVELAEDRLDFAKAMLSGRVKLDAGFGDLMRLRKLL